MKYNRLSFTFLFFSFILIILLLFYSINTRNLEKKNSELIGKINNLNEKININQLELSAHTNPEYLLKLGKIYLDQNYDRRKTKILSFTDFQKYSEKYKLNIKVSQ